MRLLTDNKDFNHNIPNMVLLNQLYTEENREELFKLNSETRENVQTFLSTPKKRIK